MSVRFIHTLPDLESDFRESRDGYRRAAPRAVRTVARGGHAAARRMSKRRAGPHGERFYKRITFERTGPLEYEYGPTGSPKTEFVGVGYRTGGGNLDMAQSSDGLGGELGKRLEIVRRGTWRV